MNWDMIEGKWNELKGKARDEAEKEVEEWGKSL